MRPSSKHAWKAFVRDEGQLAAQAAALKEDALADACRRGDTDLSYFLLHHGLANVHYRSGSNETALEIAAKANSVESLRILLRMGADLNTLTANGGESILDAAFAGKYTSKICKAIRQHVAESVNNSIAPNLEFAEHGAIFLSSQPCPFFLSPLGCRLGSACLSRHDLPDQAPPPMLPSSSSAEQQQQPIGLLTPLAAMGLSDSDQPPLLLERGLLNMAPQEQRRLLGERLFALIYAHQPGLAPKITGMLLEGQALTTEELLALVEDPSLLRAKVAEALSFEELAQHPSKVETAQPPPPGFSRPFHPLSHPHPHPHAYTHTQPHPEQQRLMGVQMAAPFMQPPFNGAPPWQQRGPPLGFFAPRPLLPGMPLPPGVPFHMHGPMDMPPPMPFMPPPMWAGPPMQPQGPFPMPLPMHLPMHMQPRSIAPPPALPSPAAPAPAPAPRNKVEVYGISFDS